MELIEVLSNNKTFIDWLAETVVGMGMMEADHGNPESCGVRFAALWLYKGIMDNPNINPAIKDNFSYAVGRAYVTKDERKENE
jgi:hypothetical protein